MAKEIVNFHQRIYQELQTLKDYARTCTDLRELADIAYFNREFDSHIKEIGKEIRKLQGFTEKMACVVAAHKQLDDVTIRTDYCSATPRTKITIPLPHHRRNPEEFAALMRWLDIPESHWNCEEPTINLRWDGIVEAISEAAEKGKPLPEGLNLDKKYTEYTLRITRKRDITEGVPTEQNGDVF